MIEFVPNPGIPPIPHNIADINDLFANFQNNWFHMRFVLGLIFGILFAFFVLKKIIKIVKGDDDDD